MEISTLMVGWGWSWDEMARGWQEVERLGYDACYLGDDLFPHYGDPDPSTAQSQVEVYDPWTVLPVMAATTSRMRIGPLVTPCGRRHPALFAKMTTMVDIISKGRLTVSMGAGNAPDQAKACGKEHLKPMERVAMLEEEVRILDRVWREEVTSFKGNHYQIDRLVSFPKPHRQPRPELQFGFKSPRYLTRLSAEFADRVNLFSGDDEEVAAAIEALEGYCAEFDRDPAEIVKSRTVIVIFTEDEVSPSDREQVIRSRAQELGRDPDVLLQELRYVVSYVGPPSGCAAALRARTEGLGIGELVILPDTIAELDHAHTMSGLRIFAEQVMPDLR